MFVGLRHKLYLTMLRVMTPFMPGSAHVAFVGGGSTRSLCQHIATLNPKKVLVVTDKPLRELGVADDAPHVNAQGGWVSIRTSGSAMSRSACIER